MIELPKLSVAQLTDQMRSNSHGVILDVRLADDFARAHLPGSMNNCVFEVAFGERLEALVPERHRPLVVVGASSSSMEAHIAGEKLRRSGYSEVTILDGGIAAWQAEGEILEGSNEALPEMPKLGGRHDIDLQLSQLEWLGRNLLNKHCGRVEIAYGYLEFLQGELVGGEVCLDMQQIVCHDLSGTPLHDLLIAHLKDHDFFDVDHYPEARIVLRSARRLEGIPPGGVNLEVIGDLTLKGITQELLFQEAAGITPEGKAAPQASFAIDRTRWGVFYGSGKFFQRLGGHLVNDMIELQAKIVTK